MDGSGRGRRLATRRRRARRGPSVDRLADGGDDLRRVRRIAAARMRAGIMNNARRSDRGARRRPDRHPAATAGLRTAGAAVVDGTR